ncbi:MAG: hypothetical protein U1E56_03055 [Bauldia sp.]
MRPAASTPAAIRWSPTWAGARFADDFTGIVPGNVAVRARVFRLRAVAGTDRWAWTIAEQARCLGSGEEKSFAAAAERAASSYRLSHG